MNHTSLKAKPYLYKSLVEGYIWNTTKPFIEHLSDQSQKI